MGIFPQCIKETKPSLLILERSLILARISSLIGVVKGYGKKECWWSLLDSQGHKDRDYDMHMDNKRPHLQKGVHFHDGLSRLFPAHGEMKNVYWRRYKSSHCKLQIIFPCAAREEAAYCDLMIHRW